MQHAIVSRLDERDYLSGETLTLTSVGLNMAVEDFYEDAEL